MARWTALLAALATTLLVVGVAAGDPGADKARIDAKIAELKARAARAAGSEGLLTSELSGITARVRAAEQAAATEQSRLSRLEASLVQERARRVSLERTIADQTARLGRLGREYAAALTVLEQRLRAIYESDSPDLVSFALGTTSFSDLIDNLEILSRIGRQDEQIASALDRAHSALVAVRAATRTARQRVLRTEAVIAARTEAERATRDRILAARDELAGAQRDTSRALASVREDRASFIAEADSLTAQSAALAATIAAAQRAAAEKAAADPSTPPIAPVGRLSWPVSGPVTSGFGSRWGRMHEGIDIGVGAGTPVHAAAAGTVVFAGWMSGYGNLVVIDHGNGLSTAYAHNTSLDVAPGSVVAGGSVIALSGNTGHSTGPHVHFEVRVNGAPVDPLRYL